MTGNSYAALELVAAQEGGYMVNPARMPHGEYHPTLFAGSLTDCLAFMWGNIVAEASTAPDDAPGGYGARSAECTKTRAALGKGDGHG